LEYYWTTTGAPGARGVLGSYFRIFVNEDLQLNREETIENLLFPPYF
jgi:hypothetical protein